MYTTLRAVQNESAIVSDLPNAHLSLSLALFRTQLGLELAEAALDEDHDEEGRRHHRHHLRPEESGGNWNLETTDFPAMETDMSHVLF